MRDHLKGAALAIVLAVLIVGVAIPMTMPASQETIEGKNEGQLYTLSSKAIGDELLIESSDGVLSIGGEAVASLGLSGSAMVMCDVLCVVFDGTDGSWSAWSILLEGCTADSASHPDITFSFARGHLTIQYDYEGEDEETHTYTASAWFRYLLVPDADGPLGVWPIADMPSLLTDEGSTMYFSEASGLRAGTVWGSPSNLAPGQCIADGERSYGSASAIWQTALDGTVVSVASLDVDGGIVGDGAFVAADVSYHYRTETGEVVSIILSVLPLILLIALIAAAVRVL